MSQRLYVGNTDDGGYDCVVTTLDGLRTKLQSEWLVISTGYLGPWKIRIGDVGLFQAIEPTIKDIFEELNLNYPGDVWKFYQDDRSIDHPSQEELNSWFSTNT